MENKEKNSKTKNILKGLAKLTVATAVGLFIYETAPEAFKCFKNYEFAWDLYKLRIDGRYLSYTKEAFEGLVFPLLSVSLGIKGLNHIKGAYNNFLGK